MSIEITEFLKSNPAYLSQFLKENPQVLAHLTVPHATGGKTVSLVERQVEILREKVKHMERGVADMVRNAQENDAIANKLHDYARTLLTTRQTHLLPNVVQDALKQLYSVPQLAMRLWDVGQDYQDLECARFDDPAVVQLANSMAAPYCGPNADFGPVAWLDDAGANTRSVALIPLRVGLRPQAFGLLVLGSPDAQRFSATMGTAFLARIGEVTSAALSRLIETADA